jgi:hypothetical protein
MISCPIDGGFLVIDDLKFEVGDLVTTILGNYGVIVGFGKHSRYESDSSFYYYVLIDEVIQHYLPMALIKINK